MIDSEAPRPLTIYCDHPQWRSSARPAPEDIVTIWGQPPNKLVEGLDRWWVANDGSIPRSVRYTVSRRSKVDEEYDLDRLQAEAEFELTHGRWELPCPLQRCFKFDRQARLLDPVLAQLFEHRVPRVSVRKLETLTARPN